MLNDIPLYGSVLADELRRVGAGAKDDAERELADLYPTDSDGAIPIAYLWARTVRCESPRCGAEIPLARSFWLCKKAKRWRALQHAVIRPMGDPPRVEFEIFEPKAADEVPGGTVTRAKATCIACGTVLPPERVRKQLTALRGGADVLFDDKGHRAGGARMLAVVTLKPGQQGRHYRLPAARDYEAVHKAQDRLAALLGAWERGGRKGLSPVPDEPISLNEIRRVNVPLYGMTRWADLFTARQQVALLTLADQWHRVSAKPGGISQRAMAMVFGRCADYGSAGVTWAQAGEFARSTFGRQALPIVWDFAEAVPWTESSGNLTGAIDWVTRVVDAWPGSLPGIVQTADAAQHPLPDQAASIWFTDPPYYDAVPYAHLSDFFYVWLRRLLSNDDPAMFGDSATPKEAELVVDRAHSLSRSTKTAASYEAGMARAFADGKRVLQRDGVGCVVFAHKTTEGWEALLTGMIGGGWTITGSWPIATERSARLNARENASLATSVHLICRPRPDDAPVGDWADVLRELPTRVGNWMERLQGEGVRGADLVFACIGPALEIFSRYSRVETADGREVRLDAYLEKVWEVVGRTALENVLGTAEAKARNGMAGALEEDARLTALFLWTLQASDGSAADDAADEEDYEDTPDDIEVEKNGPPAKAKGLTLVFDVVRRFAQPLGIELAKWDGRIIDTKKGVVRLLPVIERSTQLFGGQGTEIAATRLELGADRGAVLQSVLFPEMESVPRVRGRGARGRGDLTDRGLAPDGVALRTEPTTLDRVHAAMLFQRAGRASALRTLIATERERGPEFLRLANALSALYPAGGEEKRLLDAMLLATPR